MKRSAGIIAFGVLLVALFALNAYAWEFSMKGEYEWRWRYFGRIGGTKDLFGDMNLQDQGGPVVGFAGPNIYPQSAPTPYFNSSQMRIVRGGFSASGSDATH